jgi:hypothetical protein
MPVNSVGSIPTRGSGAPPAAGASAPAPTVAAKPAGEAVGHGVTRLYARPSPQALHPPVFAGAAPPRGETAGAHGDHKGRISIR